MVDRLLIERVLNDLRTFNTELREVQDISYDQFCKNIQLRRFIERTLHIAIEAIIDIAQHIITGEGEREAESYRDTFIVLNEHQIVSNELLPRLHNMAAFRNLLVHSITKGPMTPLYLVS